MFICHAPRLSHDRHGIRGLQIGFSRLNRARAKRQQYVLTQIEKSLLQMTAFAVVIVVLWLGHNTQHIRRIGQK